VEASGFPSDVNTHEEREVWAKKWYDEEGIVIDIAKVEHNPGLRHIAKIALNSLVSFFFKKMAIFLSKFIFSGVNSLNEII
jgi:hypothetical protein